MHKLKKCSLLTLLLLLLLIFADNNLKVFIYLLIHWLNIYWVTKVYIVLDRVEIGIYLWPQCQLLNFLPSSFFPLSHPSFLPFFSSFSSYSSFSSPSSYSSSSLSSFLFSISHSLFLHFGIMKLKIFFFFLAINIWKHCRKLMVDFSFCLFSRSMFFVFHFSGPTSVFLLLLLLIHFSRVWPCVTP